MGIRLIYSELASWLDQAPFAAPSAAPSAAGVRYEPRSIFDAADDGLLIARSETYACVSSEIARVIPEMLIE